MACENRGNLNQLPNEVLSGLFESGESPQKSVGLEAVAINLGWFRGKALRTTYLRGSQRLVWSRASHSIFLTNDD